MEKQRVGFLKFWVEYFVEDQSRLGVLVLIAGLVSSFVILLRFNFVGVTIYFGVAMVGLAHIGSGIEEKGPRRLVYSVSLLFASLTVVIPYSISDRVGSTFRPAVNLQARTGTGIVEEIKPMSQELDFVTIWMSPSEWRQWAIMPAGQARVGQKVRLSTWAVDDNTAHYPGKILYLATPVPYP